MGLIEVAAHHHIMEAHAMVIDVNGLKLGKGDIVAPLTGDLKGKVCSLRMEDGLGFVCVRASHRPYSKGVWYAADHVQRLAVAKIRNAKVQAAGPQKYAKRK